MKCEICKEFETNELRQLSNHINFKHKLSSEEYAIQYLFNGNRPVCPECGKETRYVSLSFRKYCKEHSNLAESEAGKVGGTLKKSWNKFKTKYNDERIKKQADNQVGDKNHFYGKTHSQETKLKFLLKHKLTKEEFKQRVESRKDELTVLTEYSDYMSRQHQYLDIRCNKCGKDSLKTLQAFERDSKCLYCYPISTDSKEEGEVKDYIRNLGLRIITNNKKIIRPKEIDIFVPMKNLAIEYNGLYWHSEQHVVKEHHINKTLACLEKKIPLVHIFSDEWKFKKEIIISMLNNRMNLITDKIPARKCEIRNVSNKEAEEFFEKTHISGHVAAKIYLGLYYHNELVSCLSLRKPRQIIYNNSLEFARFSSKLNTVIVGGFSKLFKEAESYCKSNNYEQIITYADLRFGTGEVYKNNGMQFIKNTEIDYWYTDGIHRYDRFKFRAKDGLSEKEIAEAAKVYRVYGCGSALYLKKL